MANIVVDAASGLDLADIDLLGLLNGVANIKTRTAFSVDHGDGWVDEFMGKSFRYDSDGMPAGGTVTGYRAIENGVTLVAVTDGKVKVKDIVKAIDQATPDALAKLLATALKNNDRVEGGALADVFDGMRGNDKLAGNGGDDSLSGGAGKDTLRGGEGNDLLDGGSQSDTLFGDVGDDTLIGGSGSDRQIGGLGSDEHTGGSGNDRFIFKSVEESTVDVLGRDLITDFRNGQDKIDLKAIDASASRKGNQSFKLIKAADFTGKEGQLRYENDGTKTFVYGDVDGDAVADFAIELSGTFTLKNGSFML